LLKTAYKIGAQRALEDFLRAGAHPAAPFAGQVLPQGSFGSLESDAGGPSGEGLRATNVGAPMGLHKTMVTLPGEGRVQEHDWRSDKPSKTPANSPQSLMAPGVAQSTKSKPGVPVKFPAVVGNDFKTKTGPMYTHAGAVQPVPKKVTDAARTQASMGMVAKAKKRR